ncbi:hypothetical protein [Polaribacter tangerinus]|uniref:hypothetical protein n=1 Tax=Polaribacter tangerinus TaxID=1920034 RepID=UPI000B4AB8CB|nr:hypothetical protein [Polaribacter tangerinus]
MKQFEELLRNDIEKTIGFRIVSTTEARALLSLLLETDITTVSLSTIRRFWGLIPKRKASKNTVNTLSIFLGYKSFYDYIKHKNRFDHLYTDIKIQQLKHKDSLSANDFKFIESLYYKYGQINFIMSLFEHAILLEKWNYIEQLFDDSQNKLLQLKDHRNTFIVGFAYQVSIYLNSIPTPLFEKIITKLLKIKNFKINAIYIYIDIININYRYGKILEIIKSHTNETQEKLFLRLILNLRTFLNGNKPEIFEIPDTQLSCMPDVLKGRYYGFQILCSQEHNDKKRAAHYLKLFKSKITPQTYIRNYLHEFIHHLLLAKRFDMLDEIIKEFYDIITDEYYTHSNLDLFIININEIIYNLKSDNYRIAKRLFINLNKEKISFGSHWDYYLVFYHIMGYHISKESEDKKQHQLAYCNFAKTSKFKRFDKQYLINYLD